MKIAFFDTKPYDRTFFDRYSTRFNADIKYYETKLNIDTVSLAHGCDAVCVFVNDDIDAFVIEHLARLGVRVIALRCAGFNNIDLEALHEEPRIRAVRVPNYSPHAIAEHAIALLLTLIRKTHKAYIRTRDFNFSLVGLSGVDLHGKTMGVIGTGRIGQAFVDICVGFGMNVVCYDKAPSPNLNPRAHYVTLPELFGYSDFISLHCPLTEETYHIIDESTIINSKRGMILINTSRGALVDTEALLDGIKSKQLGGACLDVYEEEAEYFFEDFSNHIMSDDTLARLISMPNVIVSSHQAFLTDEALSKIAATTLDNITNILVSGHSPNELPQNFFG